MRRSLLAVFVFLAGSVTTATSAAATGRGGWEHLGAGAVAGTPSLNGTVSALHTVGNAVYVGGRFTNAGGVANADRIARWNGASWSALGTASFANGSVLAIAHSGTKIYAGGNFTDAGGNKDADNLAVFDGVKWSPFCDQPTHAGPAVSLPVNALQVVGNTLYVGGSFQDGAGIAAADYLLACDLTTGTPRATVDGGADFTGAVYALAADSNGVLYAGGTFSNLDQIPDADFVAAYNGLWSSLGSGVTGIVRALTASGTNLYVSTDALNIGGLSNADHVARWDGTAWSAMGANSAGTNGWFPASTYIYSMAATGSTVFATGSFQNANGVPTADNVAYFDGSTWRPLGSNGAGNGAWIGDGLAVAVMRGQVYAGGGFTSAGGDPSSRFVASRSLQIPDASIGIYSGSFIGNNIFNTTGAGQTKTLDIKRGSSQYFPVLVQNDGMIPASFTLEATESTPGYSISYIDYSSGANVTAKLVMGTFSTGVLALGQSVAIKVVVTVSKTAPAAGSFTVTARSLVGGKSDVVKGIVRAT